MSQQDETAQALGYIRHQAAKGVVGLLALAERTAADCVRCLEGISEEQARFKPGGEWSVKEVLDHTIYATAQVILGPIRDLRSGKGPRPYTADATSGRAMQSIQELRREMGRLLEEAVVLVGSLPEGDLPRETWDHPTLGPLTIKELIALHRLHIMDHVQQIEKIKGDQNYPTS